MSMYDPAPVSREIWEDQERFETHRERLGDWERAEPGVREADQWQHITRQIDCICLSHSLLFPWGSVTYNLLELQPNMRWPNTDNGITLMILAIYAKDWRPFSVSCSCSVPSVHVPFPSVPKVHAFPNIQKQRLGLSRWTSKDLHEKFNVPVVG